MTEAEKKANNLIIFAEFNANAAAWEEAKKERKKKSKEKTPWEVEKIKPRKL